LERPRWWIRLLLGAEDWLPVTLSAIAYCGGAALAIWASLHPTEWGQRTWIFFGAFLLVGVASSVFGALKKRELSRLREANDVLVEKLGTRDYFKTFDDMLSTFSDMIGCDESDRLTVFLKSGNNFVVLGRYAKRPQLAERTRPMYPLDEGLISFAWKDGWAFEPCLPHRDKEEYATEVETRWKIPREVTNKMRMKARCIGGSVVTDRDRNRLAVIVFESIKCKRWSEAELKRFGDGAARAIAEMLQVMKPYEPDPLAAKKEGL
jgi:hypothetical protein